VNLAIFTPILHPLPFLSFSFSFFFFFFSLVYSLLSSRLSPLSLVTKSRLVDFRCLTILLISDGAVGSEEGSAVDAGLGDMTKSSKVGVRSSPKEGSAVMPLWSLTWKSRERDG
jgi:hypothetical protein